MRVWTVEQTKIGRWVGQQDLERVINEATDGLSGASVELIHCPEFREVKMPARTSIKGGVITRAGTPTELIAELGNPAKIQGLRVEVKTSSATEPAIVLEIGGRRRKWNPVYGHGAEARILVRGGNESWVNEKLGKLADALRPTLFISPWLGVILNLTNLLLRTSLLVVWGQVAIMALLGQQIDETLIGQTVALTVAAVLCHQVSSYIMRSVLLVSPSRMERILLVLNPHHRQTSGITWSVSFDAAVTIAAASLVVSLLAWLHPRN
ncbi:hypothetical protein [Streptomyces sp. SYSU K217416]